MMVTRKGVYHHDKYLCAAHCCGWCVSSWPEPGLRRKLGVSLGLPPILALALVILTGLPDILSPVSINLPLGLVLGLLLPDLLLRRAW
jgi:hypothetical protein